MTAPSSKPTPEQGAKPHADDVRTNPPSDTTDHGLHPGQQPGEPPHKHEVQDEMGRPSDTGRHGA
jgi:hypothetical protein